MLLVKRPKQQILEISGEISAVKERLAQARANAKGLYQARHELTQAQREYETVKKLASGAPPSELTEKAIQGALHAVARAEARVEQHSDSAHAVTEATACLNRLQSRLQRAQAKADQESISVTGYPEWSVSSFSKRHLTIDGPNKSSIRAYRGPTGTWEAVYAPASGHTISFVDTPYPTDDGPAAFRRELPAGALYIQGGRIISLKVCELNKVILEVKDSILICPGPLGSLAKSFKVDCLKGQEIVVCY